MFEKRCHDIFRRLTGVFRLAFSLFLVAAISLALDAPALSQQWWQEQVLYSFQGGTDGEGPLGAMVFDSVGNLYGVTQLGGSSTCSSYGFCGVVFQLSPPTVPGGTWTETILHIFQGYYSDASDPLGGLLIDAKGNLYGATAGGGTGNCEILGTFPGCGAVYELSPPAEPGGAWTEQVLYSFQGGTDGEVPYGDLVSDSSGNLYGATLYGGGLGTHCGITFYQNCGTIFELSPPKTKDGSWSEQVLYRFKGLTSDAPTPRTFGDGVNPNGGLLIDQTGAIYGTTQIGGYECPYSDDDGCGTIYRLNPPAKSGQPWSETPLYIFLETVYDGAGPNGGLVSDGNGGFLGTMEGGSGLGSIFRATQSKNGWLSRVVYIFNDGYDGGLPMVGLTAGSDKTFYGVTYSGSQYLAGVLFEFGSSPLTTQNGVEALYQFRGQPDGWGPMGKVVISAEGNIFGTTNQGGTGPCSFHACGAIFEAEPGR